MLQQTVWSMAVILLSLCYISDQSSGCAAQEKHDEAREFANVFEGLIANYEGWRTGDFLVSISRHFDTVIVGEERVSGVLVTDEEYYRISFDFDKGYYAFAKMSTQEVVDMEAIDEGKRSSNASSMYGCCLSKKGVKTRQFPHELSKRNAKFDNVNKFLSSFSIPDIRGVGISWLLVPDNFSFARREVFKFSSFERLDSFSAVDDHVNLKFKAGTLKNGDEKYSSFKVSLENLFPTSIKRFTKLKKEIRGQSIAFAGEAKISWKEISNLYVPEKISSRYPATRTVSGRQIVGIVSESINFHCFSLNEETIPKSRFDGSDLETVDSFLLLVDPKRAGADSLLSDEISGALD